MPKHFISHKTAILTYLLPSPRASARSPNSSEHSERSTGEADLQGAARSTLSSEHSERSIGAAELNISLSIAYGVPDNAWRYGVFDEYYSGIPIAASMASATTLRHQSSALRGPQKRSWRFGVHFAVPSARFSLLRVCLLSRIPFGVGWSLQIPSLPFREGLGGGVGLCSPL